ncbi:hypothetical protein ACQKMI_00515 [Lysinibacillus sp. NPDC097214]|uniref:hypothetical protein n=1 Tax=Lysinibacillus sp. NPDC097214 TaxID=3390584 RepID=UPI003CFE9337
MTTFLGIGIYLIFQISIALVCILLGYFIYDKRYKRNHGKEVPKGFEVTNEVNLDPVTGEKKEYIIMQKQVNDFIEKKSSFTKYQTKLYKKGTANCSTF